MNKKLKHYWILDATLGAGFLLAFLLDTTGLAVHQWLGILVGAAALVHLLLHFKWLQVTAKKFASMETSRSRWYLILDGFLGLVFLGIIITGLVISTWTNLPLKNYQAWLAVHITVSIEALVMLAVKLVLHRQWIVTTARRMFSPARKPEFQPVPVSISQKAIPRRDFLKMAGILGAAGAVALTRAVDGLSRIGGENDTALNSDVLAEEVPELENELAEPPVEVEETLEAIQETQAAAAQETVAVSTSTPGPTAAQVVREQASCVVRCPRGCSFPGRCHKYTDSNNNQKCDLGECL